MKPIKRTPQFIRHYKQRIAQNPKLRLEFFDAVAIFLNDPTSVDDHALKGKMS